MGQSPLSVLSASDPPAGSLLDREKGGQLLTDLKYLELLDFFVPVSWSRDCPLNHAVCVTQTAPALLLHLPICCIKAFAQQLCNMELKVTCGTYPLSTLTFDDRFLQLTFSCSDAWFVLVLQWLWLNKEPMVLAKSTQRIEMQIEDLSLLGALFGGAGRAVV